MMVFQCLFIVGDNRDGRDFKQTSKSRSINGHQYSYRRKGNSCQRLFLSQTIVLPSSICSFRTSSSSFIFFYSKLNQTIRGKVGKRDWRILQNLHKAK